MVEAYRVGVTLALRGNTLAAVEAIAREMRTLDKLVRQTEDAFASLGRSFSDGLRGAIGVAEQLGRVLRENAAAATQMAQAVRGAGSATGTPGSSGADRYDSTPRQYTRQEAAWFDADHNARKQTERAFADYENAKLDAAYKQAYGAATRENSDRDQQYKNAYTLGSRENADRDQKYRDAYGAATHENADRDAAYSNDRRMADYENADRNAAARRRHVSEPDLLALGIGGAYAGSETTDLLSRSFTAYAAVGAEQARLAAAGFTTAQQKAAADAARQVAQTMPVSQVSGMEMIRDAYAVLQNAGESTKVLPQLAKMSVVLGAVGKGDQVGEIFSAQQAGELRGAFSKPGSKEIDFARFSDFLAKMSNVVVETTGRIGPADFVKFLKQAGTGGAMLTDRALFQEYPAIMLAMGSSRAGTATSSFYQSEFGRLYAPYGNEQERIGLVAPGGYVKTKGSGGGSVKEGALKGEQLAKTDLDLWALDVLVPTMRRAGYKDVPSQLVELYRLFPRNTITRLVEELIRNQALIQKHITGFENVQSSAAKNGGLYAEVVRNNPEIQLAQFHTAENNFLVAVGKNLAGPATAALTAGTAALNALGNWATRYPNIAKVIEATAAALGVLATAVGALSLALLPLMAAARVTKAGLRLVRGGAAGGAGGVAVGGGGGGGGGLLSRLFGGAKNADSLGFGVVWDLINNPDFLHHAGLRTPQEAAAAWAQQHAHPAAAPAYSESAPTGRPTGRYDNGSLTADEIGKAMRANLDGMVVTLDGKTVGQLVTQHQAKVANRPPTSPSQPDVRLSPIYPSSGYR